MERQGGTPSFELPREQVENAPERDEAGQERSVERAPARPEKSAQQLKQPALPVVPDDIPAADTPTIAAPPDDASQSIQAHQTAIKDSDHIESEWVDKAKSIISQTQNDPYQQKYDMSKVKAEYIRKRFGKEIKTDETAA